MPVLHMDKIDLWEDQILNKFRGKTIDYLEKKVHNSSFFNSWSKHLATGFYIDYETYIKTYEFGEKLIVRKNRKESV